MFTALVHKNYARWHQEIALWGKYIIVSIVTACFLVLPFTSYDGGSCSGSSASSRSSEGSSFGGGESDESGSGGDW